MREYSKVTPQFWIGETGRALRGHMEAQIVASYLISAPTSGMLGLYYLPVPTIAHDTGIPFEGASKGLRRVVDLGFASYDDRSGWVWVIEMARIQIGKLSPNDNRVKGLRKEYSTMPTNPFLGGFFDKYASDFHLDGRRGESPFKAPSKPLRSQEQEQEQEQEQDNNPASLRDSGRVSPSVIDDIWAWYKRYHPRAAKKMGAKEARLCKERLKDFTIDDIKTAIDGYHRNPYHCGKNEAGTKYQSLELILRENGKVQSGIEYATDAATDRHQTRIQYVQAQVPNYNPGVAGGGTLTAEDDALAAKLSAEWRAKHGNDS